MKAKDVMTPNVITVDEHTPVEEIAQTLLKWRISAVPVVDDKDRLVGIVSEGDLVRRAETGTDRLPPWWLTALSDSDTRAADYAKSHGHLAKDVMSKAVVTIAENTNLADIAQLLEERRIKRVPVIRQSRIVGIVSRANLLQGLAAAAEQSPMISGDDDHQIRAAVLNRLRNETDVDLASVNVTIGSGVAHIWGTAMSEAQKDAIRVAIESTPDVTRVEDHLTILPEIYHQWLSKSR